MRPALAVTVALALATAPTSGCGGAGSPAKIALLLPGTGVPRPESAIRPAFEAGLAESCEDCEVIYRQAGGSIARQRKQASAALKAGAGVLVVDPVGVEHTARIVAWAKARGVPVLDYSQLAVDSQPDAFVSFDDVRTGEMEAEFLAARMKQQGHAAGPVVMVNGEPGNPDEHLLEEGAQRAFDAHHVAVAREYDTAFWDATWARNNMRRAIAVLGKDGFAGVYAETDSVAEGAITAMREAGIDPAARPTTGRFATLAGVRRILAGQQYMTAYAPIGREASAAAEIAIELGGSGEVAEDRVTDEVDKGAGAVPAVLLEPVAVTKANLKRTVIADGSIPTSKLCSGPHRAACRAAGISR